MEQLTERTDTAGDGAPTTETESTDPFAQAKREYRELQEENERLQARIRELETENENLQARAEAAEANADEHASRREEAERQLAQAEKAHDMAQQKIDALEGQLENAKDAAGVHPSTDVTLPERIQSIQDHLETALKENDELHQRAEVQASPELKGLLDSFSEEVERRTGIEIVSGGNVQQDAFTELIETVDEIAEERNRMKGQLETIQSALS